MAAAGLVMARPAIGIPVVMFGLLLYMLLSPKRKTPPRSKRRLVRSDVTINVEVSTLPLTVPKMPGVSAGPDLENDDSQPVGLPRSIILN
jgi:hypothetical protein